MVLRRFFQLNVSKIPWSVSHEELKTYFGHFGKVGQCFIELDRKTGFFNGNGVVRFTSRSGLDNALKEERHIMDHTLLHVIESQQPDGEQKLERTERKLERSQDEV